MGLRPARARWFEVLAPLDVLADAAQAIASTGSVQLEPHATPSVQEPSIEFRSLLEVLDQFSKRYRPYLPEPAVDAPLRAPPDESLEVIVGISRAWSERANPVIAELEQLERERDGLELVRSLVEDGEEAVPEPALLAGAGPTLKAAVFASASDIVWPTVADDVTSLVVHRESREFFIAVGPTARIETLERDMDPTKVHRVRIPEAIGTAAAPGVVRERTQVVQARLEGLRAALAEMGAELGLAEALGRLERLRWFWSQVPPSGKTRHFGVLTGWTVDPSGDRLRAALSDAGIPALVDLLPDPDNREPPVFLTNPRWVRPFQAFAEMFGMPRSDEVDPSVLVSIIAPLLFGYMFGDVGQGAVLVVLGLVLWKRVRVLRLLVPGGLSAMCFGWLFGSVFASEDVLPALWLHPESEPLMVLFVSVLGGGVILTLGLLLDAVSAQFRGHLSQWARTDVALAIVYAGLWLTVIHPLGPLVVLAGFLWNAVGWALGATERRLSAALRGTGHLLERGVQLVVNTISFARVGAFALAHAGLSAAIIGLASAVDAGFGRFGILVLGNAFAVVLEGLVVGIQTGRLLLFEFFARFFRGEGKAFRALLPPSPVNDAEARS